MHCRPGMVSARERSRATSCRAVGRRARLWDGRHVITAMVEARVLQHRSNTNVRQRERNWFLFATQEVLRHIKVVTEEAEKQQITEIAERANLHVDSALYHSSCDNSSTTGGRLISGELT